MNPPINLAQRISQPNIFDKESMLESSPNLQHIHKLKQTELLFNQRKELQSLKSCEYISPPSDYIAEMTQGTVAKVEPSGEQVSLSTPKSQSLEQVNHVLELDSFYWDRGSLKLFDYDCDSLKQQKLREIGSMKIVTDGYSLKSFMPQ